MQAGQVVEIWHLVWERCLSADPSADGRRGNAEDAEQGASQSGEHGWGRGGGAGEEQGEHCNARREAGPAAGMTLVSNERGSPQSTRLRPRSARGCAFG